MNSNVEDAFKNISRQWFLDKLITCVIFLLVGCNNNALGKSSCKNILKEKTKSLTTWTSTPICMYACTYVRMMYVWCDKFQII